VEHADVAKAGVHGEGEVAVLEAQFAACPADRQKWEKE